MLQTPICNSTEQLALQLAHLQANYGSSLSNGSQLSPLVSPQGFSSSGSPGFGPMLTFEENENLEELRRLRGLNTTECVPVPTSEHVAEIVGKQGCKIKALRAKTNTYIKTPVRGEEPVFIVTGQRGSVLLARQEILSAADHFTQLRATRRNNINSTLALGQIMSNNPGQVTVQVKVPYSAVGLVVGPKGTTIKRIQQLTHTYIVTPSRDKEPVFEVTGLPENVQVAKKEIESHIATRTAEPALGSVGFYEENYFNRSDHSLTTLQHEERRFNSLHTGLDIQIPCQISNTSNQSLLIPCISVEQLQGAKPSERSSQLKYNNSASSLSPRFYSGPESNQNIWGTLTTELEQFQLMNHNKSDSDLVNLNRASIWGHESASTNTSSPLPSED